jgi:hypothetical protein
MEGSRAAAEAVGGFVAKALGGEAIGAAGGLLVEVRLRWQSVIEPRIAALSGEHGVVEQLICFSRTSWRYCNTGVATRQSL